MNNNDFRTAADIKKGSVVRTERGLKIVAYTVVGEYSGTIAAYDRHSRMIGQWRPNDCVQIPLAG